MGMEHNNVGAWRRIKEIAESIPDTVGNVYVGKDYTTNDLKRDLLATIPGVLSGEREGV